MAHITINGRPLDVPEGATLLDIIRRSGVSIPTLCHIDGLESVGACRLCVVEIVGHNRLLPACTTQVSDGMAVLTHSPRVIEARRTNLELLLAHHADDCLYCSRSDLCEIRRLAADLGLPNRRFGTIRREAGIDKTAPGFLRDPAKCVLCGRCVRVCEEIQSVAVYDFAYRGNAMTVETPFRARITETSCVRCGQCVRSCPSGALTDNMLFEPLFAALRDPERIVLLSVEPAVIPTIARMRRIDHAEGRIAGALRTAGFDRLFDTRYGWETWLNATVEEISAAHAERPLILSFCPAVERFLKNHLPAYAPFLSTVPLPYSLQERLIVSSYAERIGFPPESLFTVLATPCLAARDATIEFPKTEETLSHSAVLTTRDLLALFDLLHIHPHETVPVRWDREIGVGDPEDLFHGLTGEIASVVADRLTKGKKPAASETSPFPGCRLVYVPSEQPFIYAVVSGLGAARRFLTEQLSHLRSSLRFVEIDACPGGCRSGGGQPFGEPI